MYVWTYIFVQLQFYLSSFLPIGTTAVTLLVWGKWRVRDETGHSDAFRYVFIAPLVEKTEPIQWLLKGPKIKNKNPSALPPPPPSPVKPGVYILCGLPGGLANADVVAFLWTSIQITQSLCPFTQGLERALWIPQLPWGVLNLRWTPPSSTLISGEENTSQGWRWLRECFPRSSLCGGRALPECNRMLIKTHNKLGPVSNECALLFSTEISLQNLICFQIPWFAILIRHWSWALWAGLWDLLCIPVL